MLVWLEAALIWAVRCRWPYHIMTSTIESTPMTPMKLLTHNSTPGTVIFLCSSFPSTIPPSYAIFSSFLLLRLVTVRVRAASTCILYLGNQSMETPHGARRAKWGRSIPLTSTFFTRFILNVIIFGLKRILGVIFRVPVDSYVSHAIFIICVCIRVNPQLLIRRSEWIVRSVSSWTVAPYFIPQHMRRATHLAGPFITAVCPPKGHLSWVGSAIRTPKGHPSRIRSPHPSSTHPGTSSSKPSATPTSPAWHRHPVPRKLVVSCNRKYDKWIRLETYVLWSSFRNMGQIGSGMGKMLMAVFQRCHQYQLKK